MIHHVQQHAKFKRLVRRLRPLLDGTAVSTETIAVGLLERLWHATIVNAYRGDIGKLDDETIAESLGWQGEPEVVINLLVECGWLDRDDEHRLIVHDWHEHAPKHVKGNAARRGGFLGVSPREPSPEESRQGASPKEPPPNVTRPDETEPNPTEPDTTFGSSSTSTTTMKKNRNPPEPDAAAAFRLARKVGRVRCREDAELAWKLSAAVQVIGENWLADAIEGVRQTAPAKPWAYLWTCLETGATEASHNLGTILRGIPPPPECWRVGLDENLKPLPGLEANERTNHKANGHPIGA